MANRVKSFVMKDGNPLHHQNLDEQINNFIETENVEVVDVKFSTCYNNNNWWTMSALLIYKK